MTTSLFEPGLLPPPRTFFERELGEFGRPSRGWAAPKAGCPFHPSKSKTSFRVNLETGAWVCFAGCGKGDMITFMRKRHELSFRAACEALGCWKESDFDSRQLQREREQERNAITARRQEERRQRIEIRECLHAVERSYEELSSRLHELHRGEAEQFPGETESCWSLLSLELDCIRDLETRYWQSAGLEVSHER